MRRQSFASHAALGGGGEPLIVVEESALGEEEAERWRAESPPRCLDPDSPSLNPYLLSPWRDTRKHSLPTPQCTTGITASQVRRLSERGGEGSGPSPREAAFLATLSQSQPPQPGGRRHSVVTISRVPATLFGRNRRESVAGFPMGGATRILDGLRRDSTSGLASGPPSQSGSTHNLELDILDDIAEFKARKVRLKMCGKNVCEVQPLEGNGSGSAQRYTQYQQRRYSDFALARIPSLSAGAPPPGAASTRRRASEMPPRPALLVGQQQPPPIPPRTRLPGSSGIVCTNTDLISILSSLTSSATEIDRCGTEDEGGRLAGGLAAANAGGPAAKSLEQRRNRLKSSRSNSFDVSILHGCREGKQLSMASLAKGATGNGVASIISPSSWFTKRHQPMSKKQRSLDTAATTLSFKFEKSRIGKARSAKESLGKVSPTKDDATETRHKVVWDDSSGTKVDAQLLGNAIEEFLRSGGGGGGPATGEPSEPADVSPSGGGGGCPAKPTVISPGKAPRASIGSGPTGKVASWFTGAASGTSAGGGAGGAAGAAGTSSVHRHPAGGKDDEQAESCEPSICSSLKDLFVK